MSGSCFHDRESLSLERRAKSSLGFTLLEILIAITVFSMIGISAYAVLSSSIMSSARAQENSDAFLNLHRVMQIMQRDLHQLRDRPVRDGTSSYPALIVGTGIVGTGVTSANETLNTGSRTVLAFTRAGYPNPLLLRRSDLLRVEYRLEPTPTAYNQADASIDQETDGSSDSELSLMRYYWSAVDHYADEPALSQLLLRNVRTIDLQVQDGNGAWSSSWPQANQAMPTSQSPALPVSISLTAQLHDGISVQKFVHLQ